MKQAFIDKLIKNSQPVLKKYPEILSAYLFGSVSMTLHKKDSDVDIAVRFTDSLLPEKLLDIRFKLLDEFESFLSRKIDVVVLNTASLKMIHQVFSNGALIYSIDPNDEVKFTVNKQKEYFDFQYYIEKDRQELFSFFNA